MRKVLLCATVVAATLAFVDVVAQATLGTVRIPIAVLADGKPLPVGTYELRLTAETPAPVPGQSLGAERWVEFFAGTKVVARELASVVPEAEIATVAECPPPKPGTLRVDLLKEGEFLRVWINREGVHYLINLPIDTPEID